MYVKTTKINMLKMDMLRVALPYTLYQTASGINILSLKSIGQFKHDQNIKFIKTKNCYIQNRHTDILIMITDLLRFL